MRCIALVARRELALIARHPALIGLTLGLPMLLLAVLAAVFLRGTPTDLPFAIVDLDRTETSRSLSRLIDAAPELRSYPALSLGAASDDLRAGRARGALLIPQAFERDLLDRRRPEVVLFYDNQHMTAGAIAARGARAAVNGFIAGTQAAMLRGQGMDARGVAALVQPLPMQIHPLFNPAFSYIDFLLSSLVPAVVQIMAAAAICYALALDFARASAPGAPSALLALSRQAGGLLPAVLGKMIPYLLIFLAVIGLADLVLFGRLGVPLRGSVALLALGTVLFVAASLLIGGLAYLLMRDFGMAISLVAVILAPAFGYMGIGFPRAAMPALAQIWSGAIPGTWYLQLRIDQSLRATPPDLSLAPLLALLAMVVVLGAAVLARLAWMRREVTP